jgi:hypothetical protein
MEILLAVESGELTPVLERNSQAEIYSFKKINNGGTKMEGMEVEKVIINNKEFNLTPLPVMRALKLDKKVISLILPLFSGIEEFDLDAEVDITKMISAFSDSLSKMPDQEYQEFILNMLSTTIYCPSGGTPMEFNSEDSLRAFQGDIISLYKLLWEIMKYNKFSPFAVVGGGNQMIEMFMSKKLKMDLNGNGDK